MSEIPFTVSARTARLIGQENFANAEGAIIELVKNCYDADSDVGVVIIDSYQNAIYIIDNGEGMASDIIEKHWMTIGTDVKQLDYKTKKERIKTGAKGIGRFALDRLGKKCELITKTKENDNGILWKVDWSQFEQKGKVISDIKASIDELNDFSFEAEVKKIISAYNNETEFYKNWNDNRGTIIKISDLRDDWDEKTISELFSNLEMLIPPLDEIVFSVFLYSAESPLHYGEVSSTFCDDYDYKVTATIDSGKNATINIFRNELEIKELKKLGFFKNSKLSNELYGIEAFDNGSIELKLNVNQLLPGFKDIDISRNLDKIGPFEFSFYFMKRGGGQEKKDEGDIKYPYRFINYRDRANWLKRFAGIKMYRDNFRVRPYGETNSSSFDWLGLGQRALKNPTVTRSGYRVRPQQLYGIVKISRIDNINFEDKSSREGLQENDAFLLFKELLISILNKFENDRNQIMMALYNIHKERDKREQAKNKADETLNNQGKGKDSGKENNEETFKEAYKAVKDELEELKDEQKLLKVLASAGLIVTSFVHELKNLSDRIIPRTDDLKGILKSLIDESSIKKLEDFNNPYTMLFDMRSQDERLKHWLDFALAAVRKDKRRRRKIDLVSYIESLERMWSSLLRKRKIKLTIEKKNFLEVYFRGFEIDLDGIFNNLIANSVDAFKRDDAKDEREIKLSFVFEPQTGINITYEDSGPGLSPDIIDPNQILEPFFTTKRDKKTGEKTGTGLGMWIVKSTLDEYKGDIEFLKIRPNFKLKIVLPNG